MGVISLLAYFLVFDAILSRWRGEELETIAMHRALLFDIKGADCDGNILPCWIIVVFNTIYENHAHSIAYQTGVEGKTGDQTKVIELKGRIFKIW